MAAAAALRSVSSVKKNFRLEPLSGTLVNMPHADANGPIALIIALKTNSAGHPRDFNRPGINSCLFWGSHDDMFMGLKCRVQSILLDWPNWS